MYPERLRAVYQEGRVLLGRAGRFVRRNAGHIAAGVGSSILAACTSAPDSRVAGSPPSTPTSAATQEATSTPKAPPTETPLPIITATIPPTEQPRPLATATRVAEPTVPAKTVFENPVHRADLNKEDKRVGVVIIYPLSTEELLVAYIRRENCGGQETVSPWVFPSKELRKQGNGFTGGDRGRTFSAVEVRGSWRGALTDRICSNDKVEFATAYQGAGPEVLGSEWIKAHQDIYRAPVYSSSSAALDDLAKGCSCAIPRLPSMK